MRPGRNRGWLLRLVIAFSFAQGAVSMARPAVSYRALALGADERAIGVIAGVYALLPLFAAVPLGRRTDHGPVRAAAARRRRPDLRRLRPQRPGGLAAGDGRVERGDGPRPPLLRHRRPVARRPPVRPARTGPQLRPLHHRRLPRPARRPDRRGRADRRLATWPVRAPCALVVAGAGRRGLVHLAVAHRAPRYEPPSPVRQQGERVPVHRILRTRGVPGGHLHQPRRAVRHGHPHRLSAGGRRAPGHRARRRSACC